MTINERIRLVRKEHLRITQEALGEPIGLTRSNIANIESGRIAVTERVILSICEKFNVNEEWLRTGEGEIFELLTEQEKVMKYAGQLLKDTDSIVAEAIKAFIVTYEQLDDANKKMLNSTILKFIDNLKKSQ